MSTVAVNFKRLSDRTVIPKYGRNGDAGADLTATSINIDEKYIEYGTDLAVEIPDGYVGYIFPRSSLSNYDLSLSNCVGVIDSNYRGEIKFRFKRLGGEFGVQYSVGDRIGQLIVMPIPLMLFNEVKELDYTVRGSLGYGSSGQ
jgi:dUTP pyrophosphatase